MLLKEFMENLNFDEMKEKYSGYYFCINFDYKGNRKCWFDRNDNYYCIDHFKITEDITKAHFLCEVKQIKQKMDKIEKIQKDLTITAEGYRTIFLNNLNYLLIKQGLKTITITKYKSIDEVFKEIKQINEPNSNLGFFLNVLKSCQNIEVFLLQHKCKNYYTNIDYTEDDVIIDKIPVPIRKILNKDGVLYQLSLENCWDIMNNTYSTHYFVKWEL